MRCPVVVCVIGDVVDSREVADQRRLLTGLGAAVSELAGARSASATTGDEFQAVFDRTAAAIVGVAALRLRLLDDPPADAPVEVRVGFGIGDITGDPDDAGAPGQSGPGWWRARAALDHLEAPRRAWPTVRWWILGGDADDLGPARATLVALDTLAARFDATDVSLARGLLAGETARTLAERVGMAPQSVGERLHAHGVYGYVRTLQTWMEDA